MNGSLHYLISSSKIFTTFSLFCSKNKDIAMPTIVGKTLYAISTDTAHLLTNKSTSNLSKKNH